MNQKFIFKITFSLSLFILAFLSIICVNGIVCDSAEIGSITATVTNEEVRLGNSGIGEGEARWRSHFPEYPSLYIPIPLPEPRESEALSESENKPVSWDLITGEEIIYEPESTLPNISAALSTEGSIGGRGNILQEDQIHPLNFSNLSPITNPQDYPWSVNCKLYMTFPGPQYYVASGTLIDSLHVLTAGHCVYYNGSWATAIVVVPAYETGWRPYGDASAVNLHSWTGWTQQGSFDDDLGVVVLDRPIGAITGWHGYGYNDGPSFFTGNTFHNPGYPAESPYNGEYMYYWYGNFDYTDSVLGVWYGNEVGINKRSYGGQSGSGAYYMDGSNRYVYTVLSNGNSSVTNFPRITSGKFFGIKDQIIAANTPASFDLIPLDVQTSPATIAAGTSLTSLNYLVHNYSSASWNGTVNVDVYLSTNDIISSADTLIQGHTFAYSFGPKSSVRVNVTPPPAIPGNTPGGVYWVGLLLNISDYDTANNNSDGQDASQISVTSASYSISGKVALVGGGGLSRVTITLGGASSQTVRTNSYGKYRFINLSNGSYTVTPRKTGYVFQPRSRSLNVNGANVTGQNFRGRLR